ncbi:MAG: hypothetical protein GTO45_17065 [Candidatus Aminicenantes bacterium]|nr:hypothetical protein [Candidatus Aminicenantes bacterium]NIM80449.1 hypothetical protein [Candidatus Aminicenantes bacterium]NIN19842.1 hypothetical protein [Candidatus Aminicenantes bacterium]NIN43718.1 hypothetical protein [Candidatus Aminicenantes bacterium]NIN86468.1 hypothetical protein [Candidatus Aminicenantes bacterium]
MTKNVKKGIGPMVWLFYLFIVFEIIYMITPFAFYYYSAYGPSLNFLNKSPLTAWLSGFFLPHFTESSSWILNALHGAGWILFLIGFVLFIIGAGQIYYAKFTRKGAVTGGLYKFVRNPQYTAFSIMGLGVLLVWPRFIVLVMFVTMLFVYYFLAKKEEKECEAKFADDFKNYVKKTSMFIPGDSFILKRLPSLPKSGFKRVVSMLLLFILVMGLFVITASAIRNYSIASISTFYSRDSAAISTVLMSKKDMEKIMKITFKHPEVRRRLAQAGYGSGEKLLNYIVPLEWVLPDLPLDPASVSMRGHHQPKSSNPDKYKVLFTIAELSSENPVTGAEIIKSTLSRVPIIVVKLNQATGEVFGIETPPMHVLWGDIPTPLF